MKKTEFKKIIENIVEDVLLRNNRISSPYNESICIDLDKLKKFAKGIEICCNGEYGVTYYNPKENHVYIMLGDSNPFNDGFKYYILYAISKNSTSEKLIKITIEHECFPTNTSGNWLKFNGIDFIPYKE